MHLPHTSSRSEAASALLMTLFVVAVLATFIGLALDYSSSTARVSLRGSDYTRAQALANGALEVAFKRWQAYMSARQGSILNSYTSPTNFQGAISASLPMINAAAASTGFTVTELTIVPVDRADNVLATQANTSASVGPMANVPGWVATTYPYRARAVVQKIADPAVTVSVSRYLQQSDASLFQAMLFFQNDLELHPGPAMTLYGLVHTNSNMYLAAGAGGSLTLSSNVSFVGNTPSFAPAHPDKWENPARVGYAEGVTATLFAQESGNWTNYNAPVYASSRDSQLAPVSPLYPLGTDESTAIDATNGNRSGTHEIIERPVPTSSTNPNANASVTDPSEFSTHRLYNSAGLRILINHSSAFTSTGGTSSKIHVYTPDPANPENSVEIVPTTPPAAPNIANQVVGSITTASGSGEIYDFREGHAVNVNTVDMSTLTPVLNGYSGYNGVVYIADIASADTNGNTGNSDAIRLKKGGTLPTSGLTLVSDGAVYVQGDYNSGATYGPDAATGDVVLGTEPGSNSATSPDPTQYTVSGYTQKPAAVMGDAVMILSNDWIDANSYLALSTRTAAPTTFNAAIVSGAVLTTASSASGGAHNFPRFLENWGSKNFTYHGSMCELYASLHFTGTYGKGNVYSPPNRRWFFDNNFLTNPPPGNLRTTTFTRGRWIRNANT